MSGKEMRKIMESLSENRGSTDKERLDILAKIFKTQVGKNKSFYYVEVEKFANDDYDFSFTFIYYPNRKTNNWEITFYSFVNDYKASGSFEDAYEKTIKKGITEYEKMISSLKRHQHILNNIVRDIGV